MPLNLIIMQIICCWLLSYPRLSVRVDNLPEIGRKLISWRMFSAARSSGQCRENGGWSFVLERMLILKYNSRYKKRPENDENFLQPHKSQDIVIRRPRNLDCAYIHRDLKYKNIIQQVCCSAGEKKKPELVPRKCAITSSSLTFHVIICTLQKNTQNILSRACSLSERATCS
jgi:hypothetical protein